MKQLLLQVRTGTYRNLFHPSQMITGKVSLVKYKTQKKRAI